MLLDNNRGSYTVPDATDGLAAAVCHFFNPGQESGKSYSGWGAFVKQEAHRIKK